MDKRQMEDVGNECVSWQRIVFVDIRVVDLAGGRERSEGRERWRDAMVGRKKGVDFVETLVEERLEIGRYWCAACRHCR